MRKLVTSLAAVLALSILPEVGAAQDKVLRIPFASNFSGNFAPFGLRLWRGATLAAEKINEAGGVRGHKLELYQVDARSETASLIAEYRRICADDAIPVFVAPVASKQLFAIYEIAKTCNLATFAPTSGANWVYPDQGKWIYRYLPVPQLVLPVQYRKLNEKLGATTVGLSHTIDDDFTVYNAKLGRKYIADAGMEIVADVGSRQKETNFASQVAAIRSKRPDLVVLSHQSDDGGKFALQLRERGIEAQISDTGYTVVGRDFWELSKGKGIGAIGSSIYTSSDQRPIVQEWIDFWRQRTGKGDQDPDAYETSVYDAVNVLATVLENAASLGRKDVADAFLTVKDMDTISGTVSFRAEDLPDAYRSEPILVRLGENGRLERWGQ